MDLIIEKAVGTLFSFLPYLIAFSIISYVVKSRPGLFNDLTPTRERTQAEKILSWSGLLVMLIILVELYLTKTITSMLPKLTGSTSYRSCGWR